MEIFNIYKSRPQIVKHDLTDTSKLRSNKTTVDSGIYKLINSEEADEFIKSSEKQNARIISDNIIKEHHNGFCQEWYEFSRAITKILPTGTTITNLYGEDGNLIAKAVLGKDKVAYAEYNITDKENPDCKYTKFYTDNVKVKRNNIFAQKTNSDVKPQLYEIETFSKRPNIEDIMKLGLKDAATITRVNNSNNDEYKELIKQGTITDEYYRRYVKG